MAMSEGVVDIVAVPRIERRVIFGRSAVRACYFVHMIVTLSGFRVSLVRQGSSQLPLIPNAARLLPAYHHITIHQPWPPSARS